MSASLFNLISLAGSASLDELRARTSVDDSTLANTMASMVASGAVTLSVTPEFQANRTPEVAADLTDRFGKPTGGEFKAAPTMTIDDLREAIQFALRDDGAAALITASPTSKGFKLSL